MMIMRIVEVATLILFGIIVIWSLILAVIGDDDEHEPPDHDL